MPSSRAVRYDAARLLDGSGPVQLLFERQDVDLGRPLGQLEHRGVDAPVCVGEEIFPRQDRDDERERGGVEKDRAENGALGVQVLRELLLDREFFEHRGVGRDSVSALQRCQSAPGFPHARSRSPARRSRRKIFLFRKRRVFRSSIEPPGAGQMMSDTSRSLRYGSAPCGRTGPHVANSASEIVRLSAQLREESASGTGGRVRGAGSLPQGRSPAPREPQRGRDQACGRAHRRAAGRCGRRRQIPDERRRRGASRREGIPYERGDVYGRRASSASSMRSSPKTAPGRFRPSGVPWKSLPAVAASESSRASEEKRRSSSGP